MPFKPPVSTSFDYTLTPPERVTVGGLYRFISASKGKVSSIMPPSPPDLLLWLFFLGGLNVGAYPSDPATQGYVNAKIYQVNPPPVDNFKITRGDGSQWIYTAADDTWYCWVAGSNNPVNSVASGEDPRTTDVATPDLVQVGGTYIFEIHKQGPVLAITAPTEPDPNWYFLVDETNPQSPLDSYTVIVPVVPHPEAAYGTTVIWSRTAKPATGSLWEAASDHSRWIFPGGVTWYRCYAPGTIYQRGAVKTRDEIGDLNPL